VQFSIDLKVVRFGDSVGSNHIINGEVFVSMESNLQELKNRLLATDAGFSRLATEHSDHERRLEELCTKPYLTDSEQLEEVRLKKHKLYLKDQMEAILHKYKNTVA